KVLLIEKGRAINTRSCPILKGLIDKCPINKEGFQECYPSCSITCGFGGAGAYSDGKFNITSEFGGWMQDYLEREELLDLINYVDSINLKFGASNEITDPYTNKVKEIELRAMSVGVRLLRSKVRHLGTEENFKILGRIFKHLQKKVTMLFETDVVEIITENNEIRGVVTKDNEQFTAPKVLLAVGREGSKWLDTILEKRGIKMDQTQVDIGVRVECNDLIMEEINKHLYEGKFVYRTSTGNTVRTFCSNPSGHVVMENYNGVINVNGHSYKDEAFRSENTNFALLVSHHFAEPFNKPNEYAVKVSSLANQLACGSVLVQKFGDLLLGRRTTVKRLNEGFMRPTLKEAVPGDLALCLPHKTLQSIIEMIRVLDKITPGIATEHTLLYGVEAKYYSARPEMTTEFETKAIKGLYLGGDGAGLTRGLAQAGACGVYIARNMLKELK
ncbi:MAG: FAD-dependent oxidoreductase, partial [Bacilli bacterium]